MYTRIQQLPERFTMGPLSRQMNAYVSERWKRASYGWWRFDRPISYNREYPLENKPYADKTRFIEYASDGLRFVGKVHEIRGSGDGNMPYFDRAIVDHNGWYDNPYGESYKDGSGLIYGVVYQLPARNGESIYVPGYQLGSEACDSGTTICFSDHTSDLIQAIHNADSMAEHVAEEEREYQEKQAAESKIEEITEEIEAERKDLLVLVKELRANCAKLTGMAALRATIREHILSVRSRCEELAEERDRIKENGISFN